MCICIVSPVSEILDPNLPLPLPLQKVLHFPWHPIFALPYSSLPLSYYSPSYSLEFPIFYPPNLPFFPPLLFSLRRTTIFTLLPS